MKGRTIIYVETIKLYSICFQSIIHKDIVTEQYANNNNNNNDNGDELQV